MALDVPDALVISWLHMRDGVYLSALPSPTLQPLLQLFKSAGLEANEFKVMYQPFPESPHTELEIQAQVSLQFRTVWGLTPEFVQRRFLHEARPDAYLVFPGEGTQDSIYTSSFCSVKGLHALIFSTIVYSSVKGLKHGSS